jgi:hypothetical protein
MVDHALIARVGSRRGDVGSVPSIDNNSPAAATDRARTWRTCCITAGVVNRRYSELTPHADSLDRIDLFELNEAFAAQALACQRELGIDNAKLNVNGGAIAIGHPLGCSGARLATTLIHQMARTGAARGIASLCVGVGQGLATVFERE